MCVNRFLRAFLGPNMRDHRLENTKAGSSRRLRLCCDGINVSRHTGVGGLGDLHALNIKLCSAKTSSGSSLLLATLSLENWEKRCRNCYHLAFGIENISAETPLDGLKTNVFPEMWITIKSSRIMKQVSSGQYTSKERLLLKSTHSVYPSAPRSV